MGTAKAEIGIYMGGEKMLILVICEATQQEFGSFVAFFRADIKKMLQTGSGSTCRHESQTRTRLLSSLEPGQFRTRAIRCLSRAKRTTLTPTTITTTTTAAAQECRHHSYGRVCSLTGEPGWVRDEGDTGGGKQVKGGGEGLRYGVPGTNRNIDR